MNPADVAYWASAALMWAVTGGAYAWMRHWRLQLQEAAESMRAQLYDHKRDAALAEWCRHMSLTVITVSGSVFTITFEELQASAEPEFRNWHVPVQVTVWSDLLADDKMIVGIRETAAAAKDEFHG